MAFSVPFVAMQELHAIVLQMVVTLGLALLCAWLYVDYRKPVFAAWAIAWTLYVLRLAAICGFLVTAGRWPSLLFWHQVATGWTALAVLATALIFSRRLRWHRWYVAVLLFPPLWAYVAIYRLNRFLLAAGPAVLFMSAATLWAGVVFWRYAHRTRSPGARVLAGAFLLWGVHHLDYPFLRAKGVWTPWGYYLDILFTLTVGVGILLLVVDDLRSGVTALATLSGEGLSAPAEPRAALLETVLSRAVAIPAVRGAAAYRWDANGPRCELGAGVCRDWKGTRPSYVEAELLERATTSGRAVLAPAWSAPPNGDASSPAHYPFAAVLPVSDGEREATALVIVSSDHDPFAALDENFLTALGRQTGGALALSGLNRALRQRSDELERLSARMVQQHEDERRRLSRELHDETAQLLSAIKMELGVLRTGLPAAQAERIDDALTLTDAGIRSIRAVIEDLRPSLLDDLGLIPALRSIAGAFAERSATRVVVDLPRPTQLPPLGPDAELALFRALQEALSNVARHAGATEVRIVLRPTPADVSLIVEDNGRGLANASEAPDPYTGLGIVGMRERLTLLGGSLELTSLTSGGARLVARLPACTAT